MRKTKQTSTEGYALKYLANMPQNFPGHQKQGKSEKLSELRKGEEDVTENGDVVPWMESSN